MINKPWQVYSRVWNGGGEGGADPVFPLFFHENPASRTSLFAITNIVFFRIPHQCRKSPWPARFWSSYFIRPYNLHYLLFSEKGALLSPSLLFSQPITNLVCNRCHFSGKSRISQISYSVNVSRIQCCFLGRSLVPGIPFLSPRKKPESTSAYLSAAYPATSG